MALVGGMEPVFLVDAVVLKRADDSPEEITWRSTVLAGLPEAGFRVARPVATAAGEWTAGGWMASRYLEGRLRPHRWEELVPAARAFHAALAPQPRPDFLDRLSHRWARAHRVAWGEARVKPVGDFGPRIDALAGMVGSGEGASQVIHADLAGNVLFAEGLAPGILDFSPCWAPVGYAEGILMTDALLWHGAGFECLALVADRPDWPQWLARGALFRIVTHNEGVSEGHPEYLAEAEHFDPLIALIGALTR